MPQKIQLTCSGLLPALLITVFSCSRNLRAHSLHVSPSEIHLGTIQIGEEQRKVVTIRNIGNAVYCVKRIVSSCSCLPVQISKSMILPGDTAHMNIRITKRGVGDFTHQIRVLPHESTKQETIVIDVSGRVMSPFLVTAGWLGRKGTVSEARGWYNLGTIHKSSLDLIIRLAPKSRTGQGQDTIARIGARFFQLKSINVEDALPKRRAQRTRAVARRTTLAIMMVPKAPLLPGIRKDRVVIELTDGGIITIPLIFRIVDDVFVDRPVIHCGTFGGTHGNIRETARVFFHKNTKPWTQIRWRASGSLAKAVRLEVDEKGSCVDKKMVVVTIVTSEMRTIPDGFVFARLELFERDRNGDVVDISIIGYYDKEATSKQDDRVVTEFRRIESGGQSDSSCP